MCKAMSLSKKNNDGKGRSNKQMAGVEVVHI